MHVFMFLQGRALAAGDHKFFYTCKDMQQQGCVQEQQHNFVSYVCVLAWTAARILLHTMCSCRTVLVSKNPAV